MIRIGSTMLLAGLALSSLTACQKQATTPDAEVAAIKAAEDAMRDAYKAKDAAKLAAAYAPDATIYAASDRPHVGAAAIEESLKQELADPAFNLNFTTAKAVVAASGDLGYTQGSFTIRYTNPATKAAVSYSGYYLTVFKKQSDGSWKAIEDMALPAS